LHLKFPVNDYSNKKTNQNLNTLKKEDTSTSNKEDNSNKLDLDKRIKVLEDLIEFKQLSLKQKKKRRKKLN